MPDDLYFHAKGAESAKIYSLSVFHACAGVVANFVTTRERREFRVSDKITKTMTMTMTILTTDDTDWTDFHRFCYINEIKQKQNSIAH